jgi:hypothetical protein
LALFDENAEILRQLEAEGRNLGPVRQIDFSHLLPDQASADAFAEETERRGFSTTIRGPDEENESLDPLLRWDVTVSRDMSPTCENITETEELLDAIARSFGGKADGWGFFDAWRH